MIQSMTAFARMQKQIDGVQLCWEIRSVNHRYLDVSFRLPEPFRSMEPAFRNALKNKVFRGKLECQLKYQDNTSKNQSIIINKGLVNALVELGAALSSTHNLPNDLSVSKILSWPDVVQAAQGDMEQLTEHSLSLFGDALHQLTQARAQEGQSLKEFIVTRLISLKEEVKRAKSIVSNVAAESKDKFLTRLHAIQIDVAEGRMEQELALLLARLDVSEELDRLHTHTEEVGRALEGNQSAGRRLDFLMQELNREANTLSSKSDSVELTQRALEMKVLIEQMREQIQNIE